MLRQLFCDRNSQNQPSRKQSQGVEDVSTVIWFTEYDDLELRSKKEQNTSLKLITTDINNAVLTIQQFRSNTQEVYLSYPDFINSFHTLDNQPFLRYKCFTLLSIPTKCIETIITSLNKKKFTRVIEPFSLEEYQIQSCAILGEDMFDVKNPLALLSGKTYQPLATLLTPNPNLEAIANEIRNIYRREGLSYRNIMSRCFLAPKKSWGNLLFEFMCSKDTEETLKQKCIKQAVINLLVSSRAICLQLGGIFSKLQEDLFTSPLPPMGAEIVREYTYAQPKAFRF